ncbi:MAG: aminotransferase class III-fold pyridoxal phosphate-dependent enzyme [Candidatus Riflebacteria bacterium]|nr:aminotransferase class III-fold pyridoxal phosphate-dependent enzyme [Candidatus Riflebacteria bacterium]
MKNQHLDCLHKIRASAGKAWTHGLEDETILKFLASDKTLAKAIDEAVVVREKLASDHEDLFKMEEVKLCRLLQQRILNFYPPNGINFYVPLAAAGPWIITSHGAVLHDSGGYGMLGMGHAPEAILALMNQPFVMANVMTPSFSQKHLTDRLIREIGRTRGNCPFARFVFLNSGSESVTFSCRVTDIHGRLMTDPGGKHAGKRIARLAIIDSFHGRTEGPARLSHSTRKAYSNHLASFRNPDDLIFIPVNDVLTLRKTFEQAEKDGVFFEAFFVEPVMGEGVPGLALTREYYDEARTLTKKMGSLLIVDSIQAALRAQGCLSIIDYPGFENCEPPDMETYSKALNAGQYPLSVAALSEGVANKYATGLYGNTMTSNPRALEVACIALDSITDEIRRNIRERGKEFIQKFQKLSDEFPGAVDRVVGTGLMACMMLNPNRYKVTGEGGFEEFLRINGIEMIHGGDFGLRFTPPFNISSSEVDLIVSVIRKGLKELAK